MASHSGLLRGLPVGLGLLLLLVPAGLLGEVATCRLGTGLSRSGTAGSLPEAWVGPVDAPPTIDGRLDDRPWQAARPFELGNLLVRGRARPRTEVRLVHHGGMIYVGARCEEPNLEGLRRDVERKDGPAYRDDSIELFLAPDPARAYFQLTFAAGGAVYDRIGHGDPTAWDSGAETAVALGEHQWSLEAAIPLAAFGVGRDPPERWRANVYRNRRAVDEGAAPYSYPEIAAGADHEQAVSTNCARTCCLSSRRVPGRRGRKPFPR